MSGSPRHVVRILLLRVGRPDNGPKPALDALAPVRQRLLYELSEAFDAACGMNETVYIDRLAVDAGRIEHSGAEWVWRDAGIFRLELRERLAGGRDGGASGRETGGAAEPSEPPEGSPWTPA